MERPQVDKLAGGDYSSSLNERESNEKLLGASLKGFSKDSLMMGPSPRSSSGRVPLQKSKRPTQARPSSLRSSSCMSLGNRSNPMQNLRGPIHSMSHIMSEQDLITEWEGITSEMGKFYKLKDLQQNSSHTLVSQSFSDLKEEENNAAEEETPEVECAVTPRSIPRSQEASEISLKSSSEILHGEEFHSEEEMAIIAEIKRIQEILNNSLMNVDSVAKANIMMKRRQNSCNQAINTSRYSAQPNHSKGGKDPCQKPRVLWALTKVSIFPDDSRTYEVMKLTDKKPAGMPEKLDSVFVLVAPK